MVSPSERAAWRPASLTEIAEAILGHRRSLTALDDDLVDGRPPASWTFADADSARSEHDRLSRLLATQVSETTGIIDALDISGIAITTAQTSLEGAMRSASSAGMRVDQTSGAVRLNRTYEDDDERADASILRRGIAEQITTALRDAQAADDALAAALKTATAADVNTVGTLTEQRTLADFDAKTVSEQVQYLLDHPDAYAFLGEHLSDEVKAQVGAQIADGLDGLAGTYDGFTDAGTVQRYNDLLAAFGDDPAVMAPMYERLGPDGMLGTFNALASTMPFGYPQVGLEQLADGLRSGLGSATQQPGFDGKGYGEDLVRYATRTFTDDEQEAFDEDYPNIGQHAAVLDYLLRDGDYSEDFVRGVTWELDDFERTVGTDMVGMWMAHNGDRSPLNSLRVDDPQFWRLPDPMGAAMGQLGEHPGLGLEFFTEDDWRATHYIGERDWRRDGFGGIAQAALGIGTDPENLTHAGRDTGMFVSQYFDLLADNPEFTADDAPAGAEPLADLLKHYMPAVEAAIAAEGDDGAFGVDTTSNKFLPVLTDYPVMDSADLERLIKVGLSTEDGMARIAEGVAGYRNAVLAGFSQEYPGALDALDPSVSPAARTALTNLLSSSCMLDGYVQHAVGEIDIEGARSRDQQVAAFTSLVSEAVGMIPVPYADEIGEGLGDVGSKVWDFGVGQVRELPAESIEHAFGSNEAAARDEQTGEAVDGRNKSVIASFLSLVQAGVVEVPPDLADVWAPGGDLISLADIDPARLDSYYEKARNAMVDVVVVGSLGGMYKDPFMGWFDE